MQNINFRTKANREKPIKAAQPHTKRLRIRLNENDGSLLAAITAPGSLLLELVKLGYIEDHKTRELVKTSTGNRAKASNLVKLALNKGFTKKQVSVAIKHIKENVWTEYTF